MDHINKMFSVINHLAEEPAGLKMMRELNAIVNDKINPMLTASNWVKQMTELKPYQKTAADYLTGLSFTKHLMPNTALTAMEGIISQQARFYNQLNTLPKIPELFAATSQLKTMQIAIGGLSGYLTKFYTKNKLWDELNDFYELTEEITDIEEEILTKEMVTKQDLDQIRELIEEKFAEINNQNGQLSLQVSRIGQDSMSKFFQFLTIMSLILALMSEIRNWIPKPEAVTKPEFEVFKKEMYQKIETVLKDTLNCRIVAKHCYVSLKPKARSYVIANLDSSMQVTILQTKHKWVYVSFISPEDNLVHTGWVMKKYLSK